MRRGFPLMIWAAVWTIAVALVAVTLWSAISRAGTHAAGQSALRVPGVAVTPTLPQPTSPATSQATPRPTTRPTSRPTPRPTSRPTSRSSRGGSATARPDPAAVQGWWTGQAGRVTATCRAGQIKLDAAVPADGFSVDIGDRGPEHLEVEFHQAHGEQETKVKAVCGSERPRFTVEED